jgi:hypothetical protein
LADGLARRAAADDVNSLKVLSANSVYVPMKRNAGEILSEYRLAKRLDLHLPQRGNPERAEGNVKAADTAEKRAMREFHTQGG